MIIVKAGESIVVQTSIAPMGMTDVYKFKLEDDFKIQDITGQLDNVTIEEVKLSEFRVNGRNLLPIALTMKMVKGLCQQLPKLDKGSEISFKLISLSRKTASVKFTIIPHR